MRLISWNVNGLRAALQKGFREWLEATAPDVLCVQETKLQADQIPVAVADLPGYQVFWSHAERKGYSGVALFCRRPPRAVHVGFGEPRFDCEGRTLVAEYDAFTLINGYFPNGGQGPERVQYKLAYYEALLAYIGRRRAEGRAVVVTGDLNTAHMERDLARPDDNRETSGFLDIERAWIDRYLDTGLIDTFRMFTGEGGHYSWWTYRVRARERNIGWRIDYFLVTPDLRARVKAAEIWPHVQGSDHCPVTLDLDV